MDTAELAAAKAAARIAALARRAGCVPALGGKLTGHVLRDCPPPAGAIVAGFWPLPGEIDIRPLLFALHERGHKLSLPETPPRGEPLIFRQWHPGAPLVPGRFNTFHPTGTILRPDYILVPLLAFDINGNRLGYGGGYYDNTLLRLSEVFTVGCGFDTQRMAKVPVGHLDRRLNAIITEKRSYIIGR